MFRRPVSTLRSEQAMAARTGVIGLITLLGYAVLCLVLAMR
jgi:hypothetical protein